MLSNGEKSAFEKIFKQAVKAFEKLFKDQDYDPEKILEVEEYKNLIEETANLFNTAIPQEVTPELGVFLERGNLVFAALKTNAEIQEARSYLKDEMGGFVPYYKFEKNVLKINQQYNKNYLETEYLFAVHSGQDVERWQSFSPDTSRYYLQYRTASDEKVRESHRALHNITLPKDDPFWQSYTPRLGWRCRCVVVEVLSYDYPKSNSEEAMKLADKATTQIGKDGKNKLEMFRYNPALDKTLFPPKNSYTKVKGAKKVEQAVVNEEYKKSLDAMLKFFRTTEKDIKQTWYYKNAKIINPAILPVEALCMNKYTTGFYKNLNKKLRGEVSKMKGEYLAPYVEVTNTGLAKLNKFEGTVYRGAELPQEVIDNYKKAFKEGTYVEEPAYTSTTKNKDKKSKGNVLYRIICKTGYKIENLSNFKKQEEVLFKPNTKFKVLKVIKVKDKTNIEMEELAN